MAGESSSIYFELELAYFMILDAISYSLSSLFSL